MCETENIIEPTSTFIPSYPVKKKKYIFGRLRWSHFKFYLQPHKISPSPLLKKQVNFSKLNLNYEEVFFVSNSDK